MNRLFLNWKTTSAGIAAIVGGITGLVFMWQNGTWAEAGVTAAVTSILTGLGLLFARDANTTSVDMGLQDVERKAEATKVVTPAER